MKKIEGSKLRFMAGLCACFLGMTALTGCSGQKAQAETVSEDKTTGAETGAKTGTDGRPVLKVGFEGTTSPCSWTQGDDSNGAIPITGGSEYLSGFEVQYMKKICEAAGYDLEAYKIDWDGLMMAVSSGKIDCAISMIAPTEERQNTMDFTEPYYYADTVILTRKDSPYAGSTTLADFSGAKVTSMLNTLWYNQVDQIPGVEKTLAMENIPVMLVAVKSGTVDGILVDEPTARGSVAANPELSMAPIVKGEGGFQIDKKDTAVAIAVTKGKVDVTNALNQAIDEIDAETLSQMIEDACQTAPSGN